MVMFAHRLALALGMPRDRMLREMTATEFADWMAFYRVEPWDDRAGAETRWAQQMAMTANINRDRKRRPQPYQAADFLPKRGPQESQSDRVRRKMRAFMAQQAAARAANASRG